MSRLRRTYDGPTSIYFVTANTYKRKKLFFKRELAEIVVDTLFFIQNKHWIQLLAYVVMPDGIHVMFDITGTKNVSKVMHSLKSMVVHKITLLYRRGFHASSMPVDHLNAWNQLQRRRSMSPLSGIPPQHLFHLEAGEASSMMKKIYPRIWQRSFYDRVVDNERYFNHLIHYIHYNPVKDGLVKNPEDWLWSSYREYQREGNA